MGQRREGGHRGGAREAKDPAAVEGSDLAPAGHEGADLVCGDLCDASSSSFQLGFDSVAEG